MVACMRSRAAAAVPIGCAVLGGGVPPVVGLGAEAPGLGALGPDELGADELEPLHAARSSSNTHGKKHQNFRNMIHPLHRRVSRRR
jgi:hypothetical protein